MEEQSSQSSQHLVFAQHFVQDSYKLLELPASVAEVLLAEGGTVHIKGEDTDEAMLCTATETFLIRMAESSNTQLLLPPQTDPARSSEWLIEGAVARKPDGHLLQLFRTSRGSIYKTTSTTEGRTWTQVCRPGGYACDTAVWTLCPSLWGHFLT